MKNKVIEYFENLGPISEAEKEVFRQAFSRAEFGPKQYILYSGDTCQTIHFIVEGLARFAFIDNEGNDITTTFRQENEFITNYESFLKEQPSLFFIECLETHNNP